MATTLSKCVKHLLHTITTVKNWLQVKKINKKLTNNNNNNNNKLRLKYSTDSTIGWIPLVVKGHNEPTDEPLMKNIMRKKFHNISNYNET